MAILNILIYLVDEAPEALATLGSHLLTEACREGFLEIVVFLASKNIDINGEVDIGAHSSLNFSNSVDMSLETPLQAACSQNQVEVVQYLLQEKIEVTVSIVQKFYQVLGEALHR